LFVVLFVTTPVIESAKAKPEQTTAKAAAKPTRRREKGKRLTY